MEALSAAVRTALSNVRGLSSLRLQNHLYGSYLLLEDIVQKNVVVTGTVAKGPHVTLDLIKQFSEIGLRYGFAMDTQLLLTCSDEYRDAWINVFTTFSTLDEVDALEETLNDVIRLVVPAEDAFFASTAETGSLPSQWVDRALALLLTKEISPAIEASPVISAATSPAISAATSVATNVATSAATSPAISAATSPAISAAISVATSPAISPVISPTIITPIDPKPVVPALLLEKHKDNPKRMFASTHRKKLVIHKKLLAFTRRAKPHV
jgi:hypothetical protein